MSIKIVYDRKLKIILVLNSNHTWLQSKPFKSYHYIFKGNHEKKGLKYWLGTISVDVTLKRVKFTLFICSWLHTSSVMTNTINIQRTFWKCTEYNLGLIIDLNQKLKLFNWF
jgi:hypothetical protein